MATKPRRVVTYNKELPSIKLHGYLITWSSYFDLSFVIFWLKIHMPKSQPTSCLTCCMRY